MHIYIDESGIFNNPANKSNIASCVAALAIPSSKKVKLFGEFRALTSGWRSPGDEVKGKNLDEKQIASVVAMLQKYDVVLEITAMDLGLHTQAEIAAFKQRQADEVIKYITPEHKPPGSTATARDSGHFQQDVESVIRAGIHNVSPDT